MRSVVILEGVRTAIGKISGGLKDLQPETLAALVLQEALKRAGVPAAACDAVIMGHAKQSSDQPNIARLASLFAGIPIETQAYTVHRQCGSGMQAVHNAAQEIMCGYGDMILAGGVESMTNAPYYLRQARMGYRAGNGVLVDPNTESQPRSQPIAQYGDLTMGMTAENLAVQYAISREEQDEFAYNSQLKADGAIKSGRFQAEIVPVMVSGRKGPNPFATDEHPRLTSAEDLAKLQPVFKKGGTVTAGNASGRNDGAAMLLVASEEKAREMGLKPKMKIIAQAAAGVSPDIMGIGPVPAVKKALQRAGLQMKDIGLVELNEAFAAQSLAVNRELKIPGEILNVNGGAIALGHPIGCSGARILVSLMYEMQRRKVRYGLATLCIAGGLGSATILERIE
jgi:acetyl-CoA C-acetyltransferase